MSDADSEIRWPSTAGWVGLVGYIIAADVILDRNDWPLLSTSARLALRHRHHRWPIMATWLVLSVHLMTDTEHDPASRVIRAVHDLLR